MMRRCASAILLAGAFAALAGCTSLATRIAEPRTDDMGAVSTADTIEQHEGIARAAFVARAGNRIVYRVVPAADYHMNYEFSRRPGDATYSEYETFHFTVDGSPKPVPVRGTVVFLHGWGDAHATMSPWALALARHGYVGILPDLRNHGQSDRAPAGYGEREARDIVDLIAMLRAQGSLHEPVFVFGESYGATTAIFTATDPAAHVDGVIALEPFVNAGKAIRQMIGFIAKRRSTAGSLARWAMPGIEDPHVVDAAIAQASRRLKLDLNAVDIDPLLQNGTVCTALLTGAHDGILDPADLRALAGAPQVRYVELPHENHFSLPMRVDWLADPLADWMEQANACPPITLPPEPVSHDTGKQGSAP